MQILVKSITVKTKSAEQSKLNLKNKQLKPS